LKIRIIKMSEIPKIYDCYVCHTKDLTKYTITSYDTCKDCKKVYKCKKCGEDKFENFYEGRYSTCRKCRNKENNSCTQKKKNVEKEIIKIDEEFHKNMEKYLTTNYTLLEGETIISRLNEFTILKNFCEKISIQIIDYTEKFDILSLKNYKNEVKIEEFSKFRSEYQKEIDILKYQLKQQNDEIDALKKQINDFRN